ncbi:AAA family ATPase [Thermococcus henrietii]|uniref:AAA family ATPase n=1 Tax=Thermococcus henrietii TaxID=2016361 RepID=UPI000C07F866|nr:ATP-binding protein [Thermococcus henrietii]
MENPFVYGEPVAKENFADRKKELEELKVEMLSGQNVIIYSPRRFGKSSLVYAALLELKGQVVPLWVDCYGVLTKRELAEKIASQALQHWKTKNLFEMVKKLFRGITPRIRVGEKLEVEFSIGEEEKALEESLKLPQRLAEHTQKKVVVVFDEFQEIAELGEDILKKMRSEFQWHEKVSYVFIGSKRGMMEKIFRSAQSPFYNFGRHMVLKKIPREEFKVFISEKFHSTGVGIDPEIVEGILNLTGCHPYYTQKFCHELWFVGKLKGRITPEDMEETFKRVIAESEDSYIEIWDSLPISQKKVLLAIARGEKELYSSEFLIKYGFKTTSQVQYSIRALREKELIYRAGGEYEIADPFLRHWLLWRFGHE